MSRHLITVDLHGDHVHLDLGDLPPLEKAIVAAALAEHVGLDELRKAGGEGPDPRFPELERLVQKMAAAWNRWTAWLVDSLVATIQKPQPVIPEEIDEVLVIHQAGVIAETTGTTTDPATTTALVRVADIPTALHPPRLPITIADDAPIPHAFALGAALDPEMPAPIPEAPRAVPPPSGRHEAAIAYARSRAGIYMRRPVTTQQQAALRVLIDGGVRIDPRSLTQSQSERIRAQVAHAVEHRLPVAELARRLREATADQGLTNDMMRVARTELAFAHGHGAYAELRSRLAEGEDPMVYKIVSPGACSECRRIWGHPANPIHYRLSAIEAHEAAGGNFRKGRADWGPTIGPTHPNCTCPPLLKWNPSVHDAVQDVARELAKVYGLR